jgi:hypothetical protein
MRTLTWCIFALVMSCTAARATQIPVQSGEHDGFTRLVFTIPAGASWTLKQSERAATLVFKKDGVRFDTSKVFDRIPRERIRDLTQDESESALNIALGCACTVESFMHSPAHIVLDVKEPEADKVTTNTLSPLAILPPAKNKTGEALSQAIMAMTEPEQTAPPPPQPTDRARSQLTLKISRAQTQGLIANPKLTLPDASSADVEPDLERPAANQQVSFATAFSLTAQELSARQQRSKGPANCPKASLVDPGNWGIEGSFEEELSQARQQLIDASGRSNEDAILRLIRVYLYFGLGTEAEQLLDSAPLSPADRELTTNIARALDGYRPPIGDSLRNLQNCDNMAAVWSVLSSETADSNANMTSIQRGFASLPGHLQSQLGSRLAETLRLAGKTAEAEELVDRTKRKAGATEALAFVSTKIVIDTAPDATTTNALSEIAHTEFDDTPLALAKFVEEKRKLDPGLQAETAVLLESYGAELKGTKKEGEVLKATALAFAMAGEFREAEQNLLRAQSKLPTGASDRLLNEYASILTDSASDLDFLDFAFRKAPEITDPEVLAGIGDRLALLGFEAAEIATPRREASLEAPITALPVDVTAPGTAAGADSGSPAEVFVERPNAVEDLSEKNGTRSVSREGRDFPPLQMSLENIRNIIEDSEKLRQSLN